MEVDVRVFLEPGIALLVSVEIVEDDVQLTGRKGGNDTVHEAEELDAAPSLGMRRNDPPGGDFKRCKQGRGAVPPVVMALARQGASVRQPQIALRPLQSLDRRLLVDTEDDRLGRRVNIQANHISSFRRKLRIVALAPGSGRKVDVVLTQEPPNILNVNVFQCLRQQRAGPASVARRRRLIQKRQNALIRRLTVDPWLGRARPIVQSGKPLIRKSVPPFAHNARLNADLFCDRTRAVAISCQQYYPRPLYLPLRYRRSAATLKHLALLRPEPNFSCFGNHPDLKIITHPQRKVGTRARHKSLKNTQPRLALVWPIAQRIRLDQQIPWEHL